MLSLIMALMASTETTAFPKLGGTAASQTGSTSYLFNGININEANSTRYILVVVGSRGAAPSTVSVSGNSTNVVLNSSVSDSHIYAYITTAKVTSGSVANIGVTFSSTALAVRVAVYSLYNLTSNAATRVDGATTNGEVMTFPVPAGGLVVSAAIANAAGFTTTGANEDIDATLISPYVMTTASTYDPPSGEANIAHTAAGTPTEYSAALVVFR